MWLATTASNDPSAMARSPSTSRSSSTSAGGPYGCPTSSGKFASRPPSSRRSAKVTDVAAGVGNG